MVVKYRFTEEQILDFLKQTDAGVQINKFCLRYGLSDVSLYTWRANFGGMTAPDTKRPKEPEQDRLKKLLSEAHLDIKALKVVVRVKGKPNRAARDGQTCAESHRHLRAPRMPTDRAVPLVIAIPETHAEVEHHTVEARKYPPDKPGL
jgi:putative transposase